MRSTQLQRNKAALKDHYTLFLEACVSFWPWRKYGGSTVMLNHGLKHDGSVNQHSHAK